MTSAYYLPDATEMRSVMTIAKLTRFRIQCANLDYLMGVTHSAYRGRRDDIALPLALELYNNDYIPIMEFIFLSCLLADLEPDNRMMRLFRASENILLCERSPPDALDPRLPEYRRVVEDLTYLGYRIHEEVDRQDVIARLTGSKSTAARSNDNPQCSRIAHQEMLKRIVALEQKAAPALMSVSKAWADGRVITSERKVVAGMQSSAADSNALGVKAAKPSKKVTFAVPQELKAKPVEESEAIAVEEPKIVTKSSSMPVLPSVKSRTSTFWRRQAGKIKEMISKKPALGGSRKGGKDKDEGEGEKVKE